MFAHCLFLYLTTHTKIILQDPQCIFHIYRQYTLHVCVSTHVLYIYMGNGPQQANESSLLAFWMGEDPKKIRSVQVRLYIYILSL